ncbi:MAG: carboxymuconolactone decarboxylase family protein [Acidobacteriota bacterium]
MTWIETVDESEAKGIVKQVYDATQKAIGRISPMLQAISLKPEAMQAVGRLSQATIFGASGLTRAQEDMIAVVVASANGCHY